MGRIIPYIMENNKCLKPPTSTVLINTVLHKTFWPCKCVYNVTESELDREIIPFITDKVQQQNIFTISRDTAALSKPKLHAGTFLPHSIVIVI